ncbi:MAG: glycoside hydrolase family 32 protein [Chloroflexi bacterium]|nr:glycoside hydrolase family 32 protein [Chloroflexota bacterium]
MTSENALAVRQQLVGDLHRPVYHFLPPSNWMNDPNGVIQWRGRYHLFYQYNPFGPMWGNIHWGHAVSDNLIHWTDLPLALAPTPGGPDEGGCFSGCAVDNGLPTIFYTGVHGERYEIQTQCMATSTDDLLTWQKYEGNSVLRNVPAESGQTRDFRDPYVWKEDDAWYMVIGSRIKDIGGAVFLYRSHNLTDWEYLHPLLTSDSKSHGALWECPNFFKLGDEWVLIISSHTGTSTASVIYFVGTYDNHRFTPVSEGVLDYGQLYAPLTCIDDQNRRLMYGWLREARSENEQRHAGWSGVQAIPRVLSLDSPRRLNMAPVPELETIRGQRYHHGPMVLTQPISLEVTGLALDITAEFEPQADGLCGIALACSPDGQEQTEILYEAAHQRLVVRKVALELHDVQVIHTRDIPHRLTDGESLKLRILLDASVVEIIANNRTSLTSRIYPSRADNNIVRLLGTKARLHALDIWKMTSIWQ